MKTLVAVTNCWMYRQKQDVIRETWLQNVPENMDVRFFLGRSPHPHDLKPDEVQVDVDDGYLGLPAKTREMCRYALANGYTHIFKTDDDVYVQLNRLAASCSWDLGDYVGRKRGPSDHWPAPYASGFSYWLSTRAMKVIADAKLTDDPAEDRWVGNTLFEVGMGCAPDYRYVVILSRRNAKSHTEGPRNGNDVITACECDNAQAMLMLHREFDSVNSLTKTHRKIPGHPLSDVAVMVKTFLRDGYLVRCVQGLKEQLPESKIVIVDDGFESHFKIAFYAGLRRDGHAAAWLPFDSGFGAKANEAVKYCDRPYVLIGSDDFAFGQQHVRKDVIRMVQTLEQVPDLDVVSGRVNGHPYESTLSECNREVFGRPGYSGEGLCAAGPYKRCDLTVNYCLIRRSLLDRVRWDEDIKIGGGEHGMFFLDIQRAGGKVAYLPDVNISELPANVAGWQHKDYPMYRGRARAEGRPCAKRRGIDRACWDGVWEVC